MKSFRLGFVPMDYILDVLYRQIYLQAVFDISIIKTIFVLHDKVSFKDALFCL